MDSNDDNLQPAAYVLAVRDLERSAAYLRDKLGFILLWPIGQAWQLATRGDVRIMLGHCPTAIIASEIGDHSYFGYFRTGNIDALYNEFVNRGAIVENAPTAKPHGMREFSISTPEGHRMVIGQEMKLN